MPSYLTPAENSRLVDAAKLRAAQLRQEAIDQFFSWSSGAAGRALRSGQGTANGLVRRMRPRGRQEA